MANATDVSEYSEIMDEAFEDDAVEEDESVAKVDGSILSTIVSPARLLAMRRAIEARKEARDMDVALNYLELDFEDEE